MACHQAGNPLGLAVAGVPVGMQAAVAAVGRSAACAPAATGCCIQGCSRGAAAGWWTDIALLLLNCVNRSWQQSVGCWQRVTDRGHKACAVCTNNHNRHQEQEAISATVLETRSSDDCLLRADHAAQLIDH